MGEPGREVSIEIARSAEESVGRVTIEGAEPRTIRAASCGEVVEAISIVAALVLEPTEARPAPASPPSPPASAPAMLTEEARAPVARPQRTWRWSAGVGVDALVTSGLGPVISAPVSLEVRRDVALRLSFARGRSDLVRSEGVPAARFVWTTARLDGCLPLGAPRLELVPCLGAEAGALGGTPVDVDRPHTNERFWLAAHLSSRVAVALGGGFSLEIEGGAAVPLTRPEFYVEPDFFLYRPSPVVFHVRSGLMIHFP